MKFLLVLVLASICVKAQELNELTKLENTNQFKEIGRECAIRLMDLLSHFHNNETFEKYFNKTGKGINELGSYRECQEMGGNYVTLNLEIPLPIFSLGVCFPKECRAEDFGWVRKKIVDLMNDNGGIMGIEATLSIVQIYNVKENNIENSKMTVGTIITLILIFGAIIIGVIVSLVEKAEAKPTAITSFNFKKNLKSLFLDTNKVDPNLDTLNGLRVISLFWIIIGHSFTQLIMSTPTGNLVAFVTQVQERRSLVFFTGAVYAVDTFLILSGFFAAFLCYNIFSKPNVKFFPNYISLIVLRYIRLLPIYLFGFLIFLFILPKVYDGPISARMLPLQMGCWDNWIANLFYYNNFAEADKMCMQWTWYLSCDFQLYLVAPILTYLYCKNKKLGLGLIGLLSIVSLIIQVWVVVHYDMTLYYFSMGYVRYSEKYYYMSYCRCIAYFIGIIFAFMYISYKSPTDKNMCFEYLNEKIRTSKLLRYTMYIIGILTCCICIWLYPNNYLIEESPHSVYRFAAYLAICHTIVPLAVMLMFYPACVGKSSAMKPLLGCKFFNVLAKLTYSAYMFHMALFYFYNVSMSNSFHFSIYGITMIALDVFVVSYVISIPVSLLFESPIIKLSKYILRKK